MRISANSVTSKLDNQPEVIHHTEFRHNPKSFLKLILLGFSIVGLPLIIALVYSAIRIDQLAEHSRTTIYQATQMTHGSSILIDEIIVMERSIQHAHILEDLSLLESYFEAHANFEKIALKLLEISPHLEQHLFLEKLRLFETTIFREVLTLYDTPENFPDLLERFASLLILAQDFSTKNYEVIGKKVNEMSEMATQARTLVELELLILIPFVILLALIFSIFIARPLRQIDEAIYNMGQGKLSNVVRVNGPENLKYLGSRLDWMRRRLLKLEEQKIQFLRHVSHELKTPLTAIREGANLLAEGVAGNLNRKQQQIASILHTSSIQLQKRIEDLLSFSALQSDKSALLKQQANLAQIIANVLKDQNLSIMSRKIKIDLDCPKLLLECDRQKVSIIVDNLVSNAIKFSPQESCIKIAAKQIDEIIQVDVIDNGIGIDASEKAKIFEPFYQGRGIPNSHIRGTGLGLSIAREYALAHGGNIELIEHAVQGAHFRLTLPIQDPETQP
ncbi:two-component system sensor histidine kinase GlrK [Nitrosomonas nitrosa]|jgi:two-component system sensor histidine kinase GlrK|uniref:HAMP domain-containing sensor histidine kinase n=1 Tax=Nitrosomonas nitrosa TaxID=52442 RepID=UPI000D2FD076|nr:HAMP domain-containing sensor histidine kinase [Nitrosomonas nitrosa]PTR03499.1 two-component system sensor histidine kinase GlrK [Nitrosomonas nitrosa]